MNIKKRLDKVSSKFADTSLHLEVIELQPNEDVESARLRLGIPSNAANGLRILVIGLNSHNRFSA